MTGLLIKQEIENFKMTELEKAEEVFRLTQEALDSVKSLGNQVRKLTHEKHMRGHFVKALDQIEIELVGARAHLSRVKIIGR